MDGRDLPIVGRYLLYICPGHGPANYIPIPSGRDRRIVFLVSVSPPTGVSGPHQRKTSKTIMSYRIRGIYIYIYISNHIQVL